MLMKCFADINKKYFCNSEFKMQNAEKNKKKSDNSEFPSFEDKWILNSTFSWIELNIGCPARNVMHTWWGSALLQDKKHTLDIIKKLSWTINMPFSIKTRTGIDTNDKKNQIEFLKEVSTYVSMITIHGRTVKQAYTGNVDREFMYELKNKVNKHCKIIGNGGIKSYEEIERRCKWNGPKDFTLDGIMIGQAAIGNPRIFTPHIPSREEIKDIVLRHLDYMISYENYFQKEKFTGILTMPSSDIIWHHLEKSSAIIISEFRKHLFQYVKWIPWSKEFKQKVATIVDYDQLVEEIQKFFV